MQDIAGPEDSNDRLNSGVLHAHRGQNWARCGQQGGSPSQPDEAQGPSHEALRRTTAVPPAAKRTAPTAAATAVALGVRRVATLAWMLRG